MTKAVLHNLGKKNVCEPADPLTDHGTTRASEQGPILQGNLSKAPSTQQLPSVNVTANTSSAQPVLSINQKTTSQRITISQIQSGNQDYDPFKCRLAMAREWEWKITSQSEDCARDLRVLGPNGPRPISYYEIWKAMKMDDVVAEMDMPERAQLLHRASLPEFGSFIQNHSPPQALIQRLSRQPYNPPSPPRRSLPTRLSAEKPQTH
jgi:hypothetical protein